MERTFYVNPRRTEVDAAFFSTEEIERTRALIEAMSGYAVTPLRALDATAERLGVRQLLYKDEASRFGNGSFKALGAARAVIELLCGSNPGSVTVVSATAGNYGRALAWAAKANGINCVIFVHAGVPTDRCESIRRFGADVRTVPGNYDDAVRAAAEAAAQNNWVFLSDTTFADHVDRPRYVMLGYTMIMEEVMDQTESAIDTIVAPGGVGGLAGAIAGWLETQQGSRPDLYVFEPQEADCLMRSAIAGRAVASSRSLKTRMLGLACGEPSALAWPVLQRSVQGFLTISDEAAAWGLRELEREAIDAGWCAGGGLGAVCELRKHVELTDKVVLTIGTEGSS